MKKRKEKNKENKIKEYIINIKRKRNSKKELVYIN